MLWVYEDYYFLFKSFSAGTVFRRQILMSKVDPRAERVKYAETGAQYTIHDSHNYIFNFFISELWWSTLRPLCYLFLIVIHLKLYLATATHNLKWVKITHICLMRDQALSKSWYSNNSFHSQYNSDLPC